MRMDPVGPRAISTRSRERADIVFALGSVSTSTHTIHSSRPRVLTITACADILKTVHLALLSLHRSSQVVHARLVDTALINARGGVSMAPLSPKRSLNRRIQDRAKSTRRTLPALVWNQKRGTLLWRTQGRRHSARCRRLSERHGGAGSLLGRVTESPALRRGERHAGRLARVGSKSRVELVNVF